MNHKKVYKCEMCEALFVCLKFFQQHRRKHASDENRQLFTCSHCQNVHESESASRLHSQTHVGQPPHSCEVCQEMLSISEEEILGTRRSIGTATDNHLCFMNPQTNIENNDTYNNHIDNNSLQIEQDVHYEDDDDDVEDDDEDDNDDNDDDDEEDEDEEDNEDGDGEESAEIEENNVNNIQSNKVVVTNDKKPSRPSRSTGKGKGNRKARFTTPDDKRKFSCSHCGKAFKTKSHLQRHILTHTGEKPYRCNICDARFNQSSTLRNHNYALHLREFPHYCSLCKKGFLMPAVLRKHLQTSECGKVAKMENYRHE